MDCYSESSMLRVEPMVFIDDRDRIYLEKTRPDLDARRAF